MGRRENSRRSINQSAILGSALGLLPFRFAAPAVAAVGLKVLKDVQEIYEAEASPVEQAAAAAILGAGEFALGQATRAMRVLPWAGPLLSAVATGAALKVLGEGAIFYYQLTRNEAEVEARPTEASPNAERVTF